MRARGPTPRRAKPRGRDPPNVLLAEPSIRDWYESRKLRSVLSADVYLRQVRSTLSRLELTPEGAFSMARHEPERLRRLLIRYAADLKGEGRLDSYVAKTFDGLRSLFRFQGASFDGFPKLSPIRGATLTNERIPTPEELGRVLERLSLRGKLILLLTAHTGIRPGAIGSYKGERGLSLGDLPELDFQAVEFSETPFAIRVPAALSKTRVAYTTFGTAQLASVLLASLRERRERGETLRLSSPVVAPGASRGAAKVSRMKAGSGSFLTTKAVVKEIREALHAEAPPGVSWRPYVARSYFATRLMLSTMSRDLREALMCHATVASTYTLSKRWGPELLADARRQYAEAASYLETVVTTKVDTKRELIESLVHAVEEVTGGKSGASATMSAEDLVAALRRAIDGSNGRSPGKGGGAHEPSGVRTEPDPIHRAAQRLVSPSDLEGLLAAGWRYVALVGDRVVIEPLP